MHSPKIPVSVQKWLDANSDKIADYFTEDDDFGGGRQGVWSIWCYLKGYHNGDEGSHIIHEASARQFLAAAKHIEPCACQSCR